MNPSDDAPRVARGPFIERLEDRALLSAFAADGMGLVFAPTVVADVVGRRYGLVRVAELDSIRERYYAISGERRWARRRRRASLPGALCSRLERRSRRPRHEA